LLAFSLGYPIQHCSPTIAALDYNYINKTVEIKCVFEVPINPLDIMWKFNLDRVERLAYDADGQTYAPFKHELINMNETMATNPHSISVLTIHLTNTSYFTNYSIISIPGGCYQVIRIHLNQRGSSFS
jgi:hypothetical protein